MTNNLKLVCCAISIYASHINSLYILWTVARKLLSLHCLLQFVLTLSIESTEIPSDFLFPSDI